MDTVLLAQAIDQHFHGVFEQFDCHFYDSLAPGRCRRAILKLSEISAFARGQVNQAHLINSVELVSERNSSVAERYQGLSYRQILEQSVVLDGAYGAERKELSDELTTLKANGYDVDQATRQFLAMEDLIRTKQYALITAAFERTRQCMAESVARAQGIGVASSRTKDWQR